MYSLDEIVTEMADAVRSGQLCMIPVTMDGTQVIVGASSMGGCEDLLYSSGTSITAWAVASSEAVHYSPHMVTVLNLVADMW